MEKSTKDKLLDAAIKLMRARGFNGTSVDNICAEAGVTKGSFFHYFRSKDEIAEAAVKRFADDLADQASHGQLQAIDDPVARLNARLDSAKTAMGGSSRQTKGCLIGTLAQEMALSNPELRAATESALARMAADFARDLEAAAAASRRLASDFDPKNVADLYLAIIQGSLLIAKTRETTAIVGANIEHFRAYVMNLLGRPNKRS